MPLRGLTSKSNSMWRPTGTIVRKTDTAHTAINVWQSTRGREPLMSICQRATAATVIGYKVRHLRATRATYWCDRVGIFAYHHNIKSPCSFSFFFLIKCQQWGYLTLIWSQLNPCLNLCCCGVHFNVLQPLTPLTKCCVLASVCGRKSFWFSIRRVGFQMS